MCELIQQRSCTPWTSECYHEEQKSQKLWQPKNKNGYQIIQTIMGRNIVPSTEETTTTPKRRQVTILKFDAISRSLLLILSKSL